jgi:hypothetical protein
MLACLRSCCLCGAVPVPDHDVWAALESSGMMSRLELHVQRGPTGSFGIALNDGNVVTNVGADSALERLDVVLEVNGESIVGDRLLSRVPMFGDMELTVLRLKEGVSQHQLDRAVRDARRGRLLARSKLRSDSPGCSESSDGEAV